MPSIFTTSICTQFATAFCLKMSAAVSQSLPPTQSSFLFWVGVQFSRDSIHTFSVWIKIRENSGLWTVYSGCWSLPSIHTQSILRQHSTDTSVNTGLTLDQHPSQQLITFESMDVVQLTLSQPLTDCWSSVQRVSTEHWSECPLSTDQGYRSSL